MVVVQIDEYKIRNALVGDAEYSGGIYCVRLFLRTQTLILRVINEPNINQAFNHSTFSILLDLREDFVAAVSRSKKIRPVERHGN